MSLFNFFKAGSKEVGKSVAQAAAGAMPDTFSEAHILEIEERFNKATEAAATAKQKYDKEHEDVVKIKAIFDRKKKAALSLQAQADADPDNAELQSQFSKLVDEIQALKVDVDREVSEEESAKRLWDAFEKSSVALTKELKNARHAVEEIKRQVALNKQEKMNLAQEEEQAKILAGIQKEASSFSAAMEAMQANVNQGKAEVEAARRRVELLSSGSQEAEDSYIAAAMREVEAAESPSAGSTKDRLAALLD